VGTTAPSTPVLSTVHQLKEGCASLRSPAARPLVLFPVPPPAVLTCQSTLPRGLVFALVY